MTTRLTWQEVPPSKSKGVWFSYWSLPLLRAPNTTPVYRNHFGKVFSAFPPPQIPAREREKRGICGRVNLDIFLTGIR